MLVHLIQYILLICSNMLTTVKNKRTPTTGICLPYSNAHHGLVLDARSGELNSNSTIVIPNC